MIINVNRRNFIASAAAAASSLTQPMRLAAQPAADARTTAILEIARRELERWNSLSLYRDFVGIADFGVHSAFPRFHIANMENGTVRSFRVAHGSGSDPQHDGWLKSFSNMHGSLATSRGAYISLEWYTGKYGTSVRLTGLDPDNSNTYDRAIVMHSASYATQEHVDRWGRLGRSSGCFALAPHDFNQALVDLWGGRLIFADRLNLV